jgi:hypothetical protein
MPPKPEKPEKVSAKAETFQKRQKIINKLAV